MKVLGYVLVGLLGAGIGYAIGRVRKEGTFHLISGIGQGGTPRLGKPKTEEERLAMHKALYGTENLPPRGTGLKRQGIL